MNITNNHNLPSAIVNAVKGFDHSYKTGRKDTDISVTELIAPPQLRYLKLRHADEIVEDVSDRIWVLLGSAVHSILEHSANTCDLTEERLYKEIGGHKLSGQADHFDTELGILSDYKITSVWSVLYGCKPEWEEQLNVLKYLYEHTGFKVNKLQIVAILRDFSKHKAGDGKYPEIPVKVIDVPIWDTVRTEQFINTKLDEHFGDTLRCCNDRDTWKKSDVYALMKKGRKSAVKLYDTIEEANKAATEKDLYVDTRSGKPTRCEEYCQVSAFCPQYKNYRASQPQSSTPESTEG